MVTKSYFPIIASSGVFAGYPTDKPIPEGDHEFRINIGSAVDNMYEENPLQAGSFAKLSFRLYSAWIFDTIASGIEPSTIEDPIPPGSVVQDAILRVTSSATTTDGDTELFVYAPKPDGRWDNVHPTGSGYVNHSEITFDIDVFDDTETKVIETETGLGINSEARLRSVEHTGPDALAQCVLVPEGVSGTLSHADLFLRRFPGTAPGDV